MLDTALSRHFRADRKVEVRVEFDAVDVSVLDGFCQATDTSRTEVIRSLLAKWSEQKQREAMMICRVAGINPTASDMDRHDDQAIV